VAEVLADPAAYRALALEGRRTVQQHFDLHGVCLPRQLALVDWLAAGGSARGSFSPHGAGSPQGAGSNGGTNALAPYPALSSWMGTASLGSS
jgi:hypothetical protein